MGVQGGKQVGGPGQKWGPLLGARQKWDKRHREATGGRGSSLGRVSPTQPQAWLHPNTKFIQG